MCSTCSKGFASSSLLREHFKSDEHVEQVRLAANLPRKPQKGEEAVKEKEKEVVAAAEGEEEGDEEKESESEQSEEEERKRGGPVAGSSVVTLLTNRKVHFLLTRALLMPTNERCPSLASEWSLYQQGLESLSVNSTKKDWKWSIFLCAGIQDSFLPPQTATRQQLLKQEGDLLEGFSEFMTASAFVTRLFSATLSGESKEARSRRTTARVTTRLNLQVLRCEDTTLCECKR